MEAFLLLVSSFFFYALIVSCSSYTEYIAPNFTASNFRFMDNQGAFLFSRNDSFKVAIFNPGGKANFYLCVIHEVSAVIVWSANTAAISSSGTMDLTASGITITDEGGETKWSTPRLRSPVSRLHLTEMGNLVLLDQFNVSLWESFQHPTDTIVIGQKIQGNASLSSAVSDVDLATGYYSLSVTDADAVMRWQGQTYWKLSMDAKANRNSEYEVDFMTMNRTGLFMFGLNGSAVVIQVILSPSDFRIAKLDSSGQFVISSFAGSTETEQLVEPVNGCQIPFVCGKIGLCTSDASNRPSCSCPQGFLGQNLGGCVPSDDSSLILGCNSAKVSRLNSSNISYLELGHGVAYFATAFSKPIKYGVNLSVCQDSCTADCSCLGIFYEKSSGSCYTVEKNIGSIMSSTTGSDDLSGYIKASVRTGSDISNSGNEGQELPLIAMVLLPVTGFFLISAAAAFLWWRRWKLLVSKERKLGRAISVSSGDLDAFYIPGLPQRFDYEELDVATDNFSTLIGSGGFGSVYKGTLPDDSTVAVKKITNSGVQGKKEFCTEIAVIGNIHHVNLVKLRGFCAQGRQRLLVYEYMSRGSLDKTLFGSGPVIEWQERMEIALGTARGLAYLHSGCEQKIIHCDVKPENILLHDQFQAKISDFGLSKLLTSEQSSWFTTMRGTRGYLAPEWLTNSAISEKTDVYSFGMVLLELVSGRKNSTFRSQSHSLEDSNSGGGHSTPSSSPGVVYFPLVALEMHEQGRYLELADPRLEGRVTNMEVERLVRVALCCAHEEPSLRPSMVTVVGMLEGIIPLCEPRLESLSFLRFYGRRFTEASTMEENDQSDIILHPHKSTCATTSTACDQQACFSYISSQEVSGPR